MINKNLLEELPAFPCPSDTEMNGFNREDWAEHFFEWYRTVSTLAFIFSFMELRSPALRTVSPHKYLILTALLNRCARLMAANLCLASDDRHDEVIALIGRSLHETAIKLKWLCLSKQLDRFRRFLADGLKSDIDFKNYIERAISHRGHQIAIEKRMLGSIRRSIATSRMTEKSIIQAKKLPDLASMMREVGLDDLQYIVIQKIGSHFVHGTWTGLLNQCLEPDTKGAPRLKGEFNRPHPNHLMFGSLLVLRATNTFVTFVTKSKEQRSILAALEKYRAELIRHNDIMATADIKRVR